MSARAHLNCVLVCGGPQMQLPLGQRMCERARTHARQLARYEEMKLAAAASTAATDDDDDDDGDDDDDKMAQG